MVFQDLSGNSNEQKSLRLRIAPAGDRLLAVFFDVVLFTPLFSLILSQLFKKVELRYYTSPNSTEFVVLCAISVLAIAVLTVVAQALCLHFFSATPGKFFFKLKVISLYGKSEKVTFTQALLRSSLWVLEFCVLCIPFVEILSHQRRQPLHDRASDTMVITLKQNFDGGPHPLETHFVKNFLFLLVCVFLFWGTIFVTQLYLMAMRGDFKKQELEGDQYLCSSISYYANKHTNRVDLALARYLAGEVDDECMMNEADFALWTDHTDQRAWAYLAKGFYFRFDKEKSFLYFGKVCDFNKTSEACRIANALAGKKNEEILRPGASLTAKVLEIKEYSSRGLFDQATYKIKALPFIQQGFENFTQIEMTKMLWALSKKSEAMGAYANTWSHMYNQNRHEFSAWMCLEELDDNCENRHYSSCDDLKEELRSTKYEVVSTEEVIALLKEGECKKSHEVNLLTFQSAFEEQEGLRNFALAVSSDSHWDQQKKISVLRSLAFDREQAGSRLVQRRALMSLIEKTTDQKDFDRAYTHLTQSEGRDWTWQKLARDLLSFSFHGGNMPVAEKTAHLVGEQTAKNWGLEKIRQQALKFKSGETRIPASEEE
jgi:uncharacterized RDD family membrane protein YckC